MSILPEIIYLIILAYVFIYTISYCIYEFKKKKLLSAVAVLMLCVLLLATPVAIFAKNILH